MQKREKRLTVKEVDSVRLEELVGELEHRPHVRRDCAKLERQAVDKLVHVVQEVCGYNMFSIQHA